MYLSTMIAVLAAITLTACSSAENASVMPGGGFDPKGIDINDDPGNFSYKFETCPAEKSFSSRRPYCQALRDHTLNQGCALQERRATYLANCAPNFEEINLPGALSLRAYCDLLKDESAPDDHWDSRRALFRHHACPGAFTDLPERLATRDDGTMPVSRPKHTVVVRSSSTYKRRTASFLVEPRKPILFSVRNIQIEENNCDNKNAVELRGYMHDLKNKTVMTFNPRADQLALSTNLKILITIEISNPGLCQNLAVGYDLIID